MCDQGHPSHCTADVIPLRLNLNCPGATALLPEENSAATVVRRSSSSLKSDCGVWQEGNHGELWNHLKESYLHLGQSDQVRLAQSTCFRQAFSRFTDSPICRKAEPRPHRFGGERGSTSSCRPSNSVQHPPLPGSRARCLHQEPRPAERCYETPPAPSRPMTLLSTPSGPRTST